MTLDTECAKLTKELQKYADEIVQIGLDANRGTNDVNREFKQFNSELGELKLAADAETTHEQSIRKEFADKIRDLKEKDTQLQNDIDVCREQLFKTDTSEGTRIKRLHDKFRNFDEFMIKNDLGGSGSSEFR
jgi:DICT domain-containing protein